LASGGVWTFGQTRWQNRFDKVERDPGDDGGVPSFSNEFDTDSGAEEAMGAVFGWQWSLARK
jgi:hypothetical protein